MPRVLIALSNLGLPATLSHSTRAREASTSTSNFSFLISDSNAAKCPRELLFAYTGQPAKCSIKFFHLHLLPFLVRADLKRILRQFTAILKLKSAHASEVCLPRPGTYPAEFERTHAACQDLHLPPATRDLKWMKFVSKCSIHCRFQAFQLSRT